MVKATIVVHIAITEIVSRRATQSTTIGGSALPRVAPRARALATDALGSTWWYQGIHLGLDIYIVCIVR